MTVQTNGVAVHRAAQFYFRYLADRESLNQDEEFCEVRIGEDWQRIRFHDYDQIFAVPGLYEALFYGRLKCCSPQRVAGLLDDVLSDFPQRGGDLRVLDIGAGNGMMGQEMRLMGARHVVGVDIIAEAKTATERDRPGVYDDYLVADLTALTPQQTERLEAARANCLTCVAALGFGDIPPLAFATAYNLIDDNGWLAFTIKENFLDPDCDVSGFSGLVRQLRSEGLIRVQAYRRYRHRLSITGKPLHYVAMVVTKLREIPEEWFERMLEAEA